MIHARTLLGKSGVSVTLVLASLGKLLTDSGESVNEGKPYIGQQGPDPNTRGELTDVGQDNEADNSDTNILPTQLVMVEKVVSVPASDTMASIGPSNVNEGQNSKTQDMGAKWLVNESVGRNGTERDSYILSSDAGVDEYLDQSNDTVDCILVQNEELCVPAFGEDFINCANVSQ
jgi:hypothetical protein